MYKRWWESLIILGLCLLFPMVLLWFLPDVPSSSKSGKEITEPPETSRPSQTSDNKTADHLMISVQMKDEKVVQIDLEEYVLGVVLAEMPASFETEALKAQAVVARTYTLRRVNGNAKHLLAAVCTNADCCQAYRAASEYLEAGGTEENLDKVRTAVLETTGQVLVYNGQLIEATYFSCSGGFTEDAAAVWGEDIPYLQATTSPGEESANHYIDTVYFSSDAFKSKLGVDLAGDPVSWFGDVSYTQGMGVDKIEIGDAVYTGTQLRKLLELRSTAFAVTVLDDTIVITTKGYGHRVGMSQYGADAMAINGCDYKEILYHYYSGTRLTAYQA